MSDYFLPEDILMEILKRLPIRKIVQCTAVSKSWESLIRSPDFFSAHLQRSQKTQPSLLLIGHYRFYGDESKRCFEGQFYSLHLDNESLDPYKQLDSPFLRANPSFYFLGSCSGLVCLISDRLRLKYTYVFWNPAIIKFVLLPCPRVTFQAYGEHTAVLGFGYDSTKKDYKLVRLAHLKSQDTFDVELYSLSANYWRDLKSSSSLLRGKIFYEQFSIPVFLHGKVHWILQERASGRLLILTFDVVSEMFDEMSLPEALVNETISSLRIEAFSGWLCIIHGENDDECFLWVKRRCRVAESWTKLCAFDHEGGTREIMWLRDGGELLLGLSDDLNYWLVSYQPDGNQTKELKIGAKDNSYPDGADIFCFHVNTFVESLALFDVSDEFGF